jgi:transcriptional regulator GlxA family with amidase domain
MGVVIPRMYGRPAAIRGMLPETAVVVFPGFDELDAVGPYEVLADAGFDPALVTLDPAERVRATHGLQVEPDGTLGDPSLLVVPGGGWNAGGPRGVRRAIEDDRLPAAVRECHAAGTTVASVCTGAMVLAAAGLLDGRPATTHRGALGDLPETTEVRERRVVDDGDVLTAAGVTAGLDLALHLVERYAGDGAATRAAERIEYAP